MGISGGKDSLSLLKILSKLHPHVEAIHIPFSSTEPGTYHEFCQSLAPYHVPDIEISKLIKTTLKKPCFNCTKARRKVILEYAESRNIRKIVFAHHRDDVIETFIMNMLYQDELSTMNPRQPLFGGRFEIIRPLYMVPEYLIRKYADENSLPIAKNTCGYGDQTKRSYVRKLLHDIQLENTGRDIREHVFNSLLNPNFDFMP